MAAHVSSPSTQVSLVADKEQGLDEFSLKSKPNPILFRSGMAAEGKLTLSQF